MAGLGSIGQNGADEFFETIIYGLAYDEARLQINSMTKDVDSAVLQDAIQGMMTIISSGLIFLLIRKQEAFINGVFEVAKGLTVILLGSGYAQKIGNKLKSLKGVKAFKFLSTFKSAYSDRVATAQLVVTHANTHFTADSTTQNETNSISSAMQMQEHLVSKEKLNHAVGNSKAQSYKESLMLKLVTKSFTANDEVMIKKMLGRDTATSINIADMNKIADFMFVTDTDGNVSGLTEQMFSFINGLGYTHK